jgi:hypothetical protein
MVKLKGPLQSFQAAGSLGGALVFAQSKGRHYLKKLTAPAQPRSPVQVANRAFLEFLTHAWTYTATAEKATWIPDAERLNLDPYRAFLKHNIHQLTIDKQPTRAKGYTATGPTGSTSNRTATPRNRTIRLSFDKSYGAYAWILQLTRGTTSDFTPGPTNTVHCFDISQGSHWEWTDGPLPPGPYWYKHRFIQLYNQIHGWFAFANCTL